MTKSRKIRPEDVLCIIFSYTRDVGPVDLRTLRKTLRLCEEELGEHLRFLRERGLLADHPAPRLTFVGLATAVRLLPTYVPLAAPARAKTKAA